MTRTIRTLRATGWVLLAALAVSAGCGGSGSSGFEPLGLEAPLIEQAIDEHRCVQGGSGLVICPAGLFVPSPISGMPDPARLRVEASVAPSAVDCAPGATASPCSLTLVVSTEGLPAGAQIRVALRVLPDGEWRVGGPLEIVVSADGSATAEPVILQLDALAAGDRAVQVSVLVLPGPDAVAAEVDELRETGASYAFVLPAVPLTSAAP